MVRLVLRLSARAKLAAGVTALGVLLILAAKFKQVSWLGGVGTVLFFGGVLWYYAERFLHARRRREALHEGDDDQVAP